MGATQSTNRAAKFSGTRKSVRSCNSAPPTAPMVRRQLSQRNTNRNVKEFSKFWSGGGSFRPKGSCTRRSDSVRRSNSVRRTRAQSAEHSRRPSRALTPVPTPYVSPRSPHNSYPQDMLTPRTPSQRSAYAPSSPSRYDNYVDDVLFDSSRTRVYESNPEQLHALQFPHETAIY
ncbi:hypothetical protein Y032_0006g3041 [Ancylostoma ceylanicum]|uniref:Uncharacterized protein n=1 Tax=Ancylostoma ceylanicum TaxID=53326 RepID=A0A016VRD0_9BILA|nr:hypothetical protein Y032_0006g3041 [Ancylostoma ceylanicum]